MMNLVIGDKGVKGDVIDEVSGSIFSSLNPDTHLIVFKFEVQLIFNFS